MSDLKKGTTKVTTIDLDTLQTNEELKALIKDATNQFFTLNSIYDAIHYRLEDLNCLRTSKLYHSIAHKFPQLSDVLTDILNIFNIPSYGWNATFPYSEIEKEADTITLSELAVSSLLTLAANVHVLAEWFNKNGYSAIAFLIMQQVETEIIKLFENPMKIRKACSSGFASPLSLETFVDINKLDEN